MELDLPNDSNEFSPEVVKTKKELITLNDERAADGMGDEDDMP